ncbi:MAG: hypothetical protein H6Q05_1875 [Acidobacteria bacterium]|nr:hypothetical protein [Acidobacteriota bacterium]
MSPGCSPNSSRKKVWAPTAFFSPATPPVRSMTFSAPPFTEKCSSSLLSPMSSSAVTSVKTSSTLVALTSRMGFVTVTFGAASPRTSISYSGEPAYSLPPASASCTT